MIPKGVNLVRNITTKASNKTSNKEILPIIINRNPRNLEKLRIAKKPTGFVVDKKTVEFWHKLEVIPFNKYVVAQIVHNTEKVVVRASTDEWALKKFLYSTADMQAYLCLAKVFAERCLESGIYCFLNNCSEKAKNSSKLQLFLKTLEDEGLTLEEPPCFDINKVWNQKREKRPWTVLED